MAAQPNPSEIINLLLIVVLVPLTVASVRRYNRPGGRASMAGYMSIAFAVLLAVLEHPLQMPVVTDIKNALYAFGAVAFAVSIWRLNLATRRGEVA